MSHEKKRSAKSISRRNFLLTTAAAGIGVSAPWMWTKQKGVAQVTANVPTILDPRFSARVLDPTKIPKFTDRLPVPDDDTLPGGKWPVISPVNAQIQIRLIEKTVNILPTSTGLPTKVWCYRDATATTEYTSTFLGPTMLATSGVSNDVIYDYTQVPTTGGHLLKDGSGTKSVVDKHVHGTDMGEPEVRFIAHLHGAKGVEPASDGYAEAWVTPDGTQNSPNPTPPGSSVVPPQGPSPGTHKHTYPNAQGAGLAWYHDHALGITRLNVYAGGAGGYIITDDVEKGYIDAGQLPDLGIPIVIQDRMFYSDGSLAYPDLDANTALLIATPGCTGWPASDVSTRPEYFGDVIVVNGKTWPYLQVEPRIYRFRFLNGCNSRVLDLSFSPSLNFSIIGTEGGFLPRPSVVRNNLIMGGAERFDVLVDFRKFAGKTLTLLNKGAKKPFPKGTPPNPQSDGVVMQFRVKNVPPGPALATPPPQWTQTIPALAQDAAVTRRVLLYEGRDQYGRIQPLLGTILPSTGASPGPFQATAQYWQDAVTETPQAGTIEIWEIFNTTADTHPIHIHAVLFNVWQRQTIAFDKKLATPLCPPGATPTFPITLIGSPKPGAAYEQGFKDTALAYPGEVTRLVVDFRNVTPGRFVWHCHILEHEDHEMMRPYDITS